MDALDKKGRIFNIQKYSIYDGDGIRTLVFLKGCNIRCDWCANPEGISSHFQVMFSRGKCVNCGQCADACPVNIFSQVIDARGDAQCRVDRHVDCIGCRKCEEVCLSGALDIMGKDVTVRELLEVIEQDVDFYQTSGGGVTLGGGELSMQTDFAVALLSECKKRMINTAIETNGTTSLGNYERLAACTDMFLYDLKHIDSARHRELFGIGNERIKKNLEHLVSLGASIVVRMPLVRGCNDSREAIVGAIEYVIALAKRGGIRRIDILPYHQLGKSKYDRLEMDYPIADDPSYSSEELDRLALFFQRYDFDIRLVRH